MIPVVVIGGGPAGSVCARQLASMGHSVVLFEKQAGRAPRPAETCAPRVLMAIEAACGATLPQELFVPIGSFWSAWGSPEFAAHRLAFWQAGQGGVVARPALDEWLLGLAERAGVVVHRGCEVKDGRLDGNWQLAVSCGNAVESFSACFVVEATGPMTRSPVKVSATRLFTDRLVCISADLPRHERTDVIAGVEACPDGWWYTAPAAEGLQTVSFFTDADSLPSPDRRLQDFFRALQATHHVRCSVGDALAQSRLRSVCARTSIRRLLCSSSWVAVGDAARTIDPLSGGGIGRAVHDSVTVANAVSQSLRGSNLEPLRTYAVSCARSFEEQVAFQHDYYASESRWRQRGFWSRRASGKRLLNGGFQP